MGEEIQLTFVVALIVAFSTVAAKVTARWLTMPMVFVGVGLVTGPTGLGILTLDPGASLIQGVAEATLVLVLFADASRIRLHALRQEAGLPIRLLRIGLPLTIVAGTAMGMVLFPEWTVVQAALVAAILAPTDAALGQAVVSSSAVPSRVRQALNVESGLNDGIALPVVLVLVALASSSGEGAQHWVGFWVAQVVLGPVVGGLVGAGAGALLRIARQADWTERSWASVGSLGVAALCYLAAELVGGNGFMAAFVGGAAFGAASGPVRDGVHSFLEVEGELLQIGVFLLVGCALAGPALAALTPRSAVYAIGSLTVVRMVPVALSMWGAGASKWTVGFLGWFGPRGLASVLFGLLVMEAEIGAAGGPMFDVVILTVLGSVAAHGATSAWGAQRYGRLLEEGSMEHEDVMEYPLRRVARPR